MDYDSVHALAEKDKKIAINNFLEMGKKYTDIRFTTIINSTISSYCFYLRNNDPDSVIASANQLVGQNKYKNALLLLTSFTAKCTTAVLSEKIQRLIDSVKTLKNSYDSTMAVLYKQWKTKYSGELTRINDLEEQIAANENAILQLQPSLPTYQIRGKITELSGSTATIWGTAIPDDGLEGYHAGAVFENGNILVENIDKAGMRGANIYEGHHCYLNKTFGTGGLGQKVPIFCFGSCSREEKSAATQQVDKSKLTLIDNNSKLSNQLYTLKKAISYDEMMTTIDQ